MSAAPHIDEDEPCSVCGKSYPGVVFVLKKDGSRARRKCKSCINLANRARPGYREKHNELNRDSYYRNHEHSLESSRKYYRTNAKKHLARVVSWRTKNKKKVAGLNSKYGYKRLYGLSVDDLNQLWLDQNGMCGICHRVILNPATDIVGNGTFGKGTNVDHDHDTGEVRGLLCTPCNTAIGLLQENAEIMMTAIDWVQRTKKVLSLIS